MAKKFEPVSPLQHKVDYLMKVVYFLETKLGSLELSLLELQNISPPPLPLQGAVQVNGFFAQSHQPKVNLSEEELIELYNNIPQVLNAYAVSVSLTAESYREETSGKIFFEINASGSYWLLSCESDNCWLVPSVNLKPNIYRVRTLERIFITLGGISADSRDFILEKPARVSRQQNNKLWQLENLGKLEFGELGSQKQPLKFKLEELNQANRDLQSKLEEVTLRLQILEDKFNRKFSNLS
jgi:hypothetical protein